MAAILSTVNNMLGCGGGLIGVAASVSTINNRVKIRLLSGSQLD